MRGFKYVLLGLAAGLCFALPARQAQAQISIGIGIGGEPTCPYGYYGYAPYRCAPYGYYGPQWFSNGAFIGAGRWYHGPAHFNGPVDRHFDDRHGYRGDHPQPGQGYHEPDDHFGNFHASHMADPNGHYHGHPR